jgi:hypothetical protein
MPKKRQGVPVRKRFVVEFANRRALKQQRLQTILVIADDGCAVDDGHGYAPAQILGNELPVRFGIAVDLALLVLHTMT